MPVVEIKLQEGVGQKRDAGRFTSEVEVACSAAASNAARRGAKIARGLYGETGLGWSISYHQGGGGATQEIVGTGQWVEAAEYGIPAHVITPHGDYSLANKEEDFGPIMPPGSSVTWTPDKAQPHHIIERAGDQIAAEFAGILVSFLP